MHFVIHLQYPVKGHTVRIAVEINQLQPYVSVNEKHTGNIWREGGKWVSTHYDLVEIAPVIGEIIDRIPKLFKWGLPNNIARIISTVRYYIDEKKVNLYMSDVDCVPEIFADNLQAWFTTKKLKPDYSVFVVNSRAPIGEGLLVYAL